MTTPINPADRQPKGDHNRRLDLGLELEQLAAEAGVTPEQLHEYETTSPAHSFDASVAERVGAALERIEADPPESQSVRT